MISPKLNGLSPAERTAYWKRVIAAKKAARTRKINGTQRKPNHCPGCGRFYPRHGRVGGHSEDCSEVSR